MKKSISQANRVNVLKSVGLDSIDEGVRCPITKVKQDKVLQIPLKDIIVKDRFRTIFNKEAMDSLVESIQKHGLFHPITIDEDNNLIIGERRYRAHLEMGVSTIKAFRVIGKSLLEKKEMEIAENIVRNDFTWVERVKGLKMVHMIKQAIHGVAIQGHLTDSTWKASDTANAFGYSTGKVSMDITIAEGIEQFPELEKCNTKQEAFTKYKQILKAQLSKVVVANQVHQDTSDVLIHGDALKLLFGIQCESIDCIITDPPFGIDISKAEQYKYRYDTIYDDIPHQIEEMIDLLCRDCFRVLKDDTIMLMFYPVQKYSWMVNTLKNAGFTVYPFPCIWYKGDAFPYASSYHVPVGNYETFLFCTKGNPKLNKPMLSAYSVPRMPPSQKIHPLERPLQLMRLLIEMVSKPGDLILDCFAGSGSTLVAALELNRRAIGFERDDAFYVKTLERLNKREEI